MDYLTVPIVMLLVVQLYTGCTTNKRSIPFGCLLQLLVQGHRGPFVYFLESCQFLLWMLKDQETVDQEAIKITRWVQ
jgi:hypothetical protein